MPVPLAPYPAPPAPYLPFLFLNFLPTNLPIISLLFGDEMIGDLNSYFFCII